MSYAGSTTLRVELDPHWSSFSMTNSLSRRTGLGPSIQYLPDRTGHGSHASTTGGNGSHLWAGNESFVLIDATQLLHRWNLPRAQANLWFFAGVGVYGASGTRDAVTIQVPDGTSTSPSGPIPNPSPGHHHHGSSLPLVTPSSLSGAAGSQLLQVVSTTPSALRIAARPGLQFDAETTRLRVEGKAMLYLAPGIERPLLSATAGAALTEPSYGGFQPWLEFEVRAMPGVVDQVELIPKLRLLHRRIVVDIGYSSLGSLVGGLTYTF